MSAPTRTGDDLVRGLRFKESRERTERRAARAAADEKHRRIAEQPNEDYVETAEEHAAEVAAEARVEAFEVRAELEARMQQGDLEAAAALGWTRQKNGGWTCNRAAVAKKAEGES